MSQIPICLSSKDVSFSSNQVNNATSPVVPTSMAPFSPQMGAVPGSKGMETTPQGVLLAENFEDVKKFMSDYKFDFENIALFSDVKLEKLIGY